MPHGTNSRRRMSNALSARCGHMACYVQCNTPCVAKLRGRLARCPVPFMIKTTNSNMCRHIIGENSNHKYKWRSACMYNRGATHTHTARTHAHVRVPNIELCDANRCVQAVFSGAHLALSLPANAPVKGSRGALLARPAAAGAPSPTTRRRPGCRAAWLGPLGGPPSPAHGCN